MTQQQIDLIKKEQDQFLTLEMGPITQFMETEPKKMNYLSFFSEQSYIRSRKRIRTGKIKNNCTKNK